MTIKTLGKLRAWHVTMRDLCAEAGAPSKRISHIDAIRVIDDTKSRHQSIVKNLLARLSNCAQLRRRDQETIRDMDANLMEANRQLEAERQITMALNDRLEEYEQRAKEGQPSTEELHKATHAINVQSESIRMLEGQLAAERERTERMAARIKELEGQQTNPVEAVEAELKFVLAAIAEIQRARRKHTSTDAMCNALAEEVGEVAQALADEPYSHVYTECVQVASTAMRVALDGDRAVDMLRFRKGLDPLPGATVYARTPEGDAPIPPHPNCRCVFQAAEPKGDDSLKKAIAFVNDLCVKYLATR